MRRLLTHSCLLAAVSMVPQAFGQSPGNIIYKHVDENGRVTYANSPIKGGARVTLDPLTVIPSTPSGSLASTTAPAKAVAVAKVSVPEPVATVLASSHSSQPSPTRLLAGSAEPATVEAQATVAAPAVEAPTQVASVDSLEKLTQQRRAETRKRLLEGELQTEQQMLAGARSKLDEEQKLSPAIRAMRASFVATAETATPEKPLITPEKKAEIEQHFERVRNLQDQVALHENHVQELRTQLAALK